MRIAEVFYGNWPTKPTMHIELTLVDLGPTGNHSAVLFILWKRLLEPREHASCLGHLSYQASIFTSSGEEGLNLGKVDSHGINCPLTSSQDGFMPTTDICACSTFIQTEEALLYNSLWNIFPPPQINITPNLIPVSYGRPATTSQEHTPSYNSLGRAPTEITATALKGRDEYTGCSKAAQKTFV